VPGEGAKQPPAIEFIGGSRVYERLVLPDARASEPASLIAHAAAKGQRDPWPDRLDEGARPPSDRHGNTSVTLPDRRRLLNRQMGGRLRRVLHAPAAYRDSDLLRRPRTLKRREFGGHRRVHRRGPRLRPNRFTPSRSIIRSPGANLGGADRLPPMPPRVRGPPRWLAACFPTAPT
jgi:hypothetical protein